MLGGLCFWLFQTDAKNFSNEKLVVLGKYQNFFLQIEKKFWTGICLVGCPKSVHYRLLTVEKKILKSNFEKQCGGLKP